MIRHLVFYKFKPEITDTQITALFQKLSLLKEKVPGIIALHWGRSLNQANTAGFTYALSVDLESESVFKEYSPHPLHMEVKAAMKPLLAGDLFMFDFLI